LGRDNGKKGNTLAYEILGQGFGRRTLIFEN